MRPLGHIQGPTYFGGKGQSFPSGFELQAPSGNSGPSPQTTLLLDVAQRPQPLLQLLIDR